MAAGHKVKKKKKKEGQERQPSAARRRRDQGQGTEAPLVSEGWGMETGRDSSSASGSQSGQFGSRAPHSATARQVEAAPSAPSGLDQDLLRLAVGELRPKERIEQGMDLARKLDPMNDWKRNKKDFDENTVKELLLLVSVLAMTTSLQTKVVRSVVIFVLECKVNSPYQVAAKRKTKELHDALMSLDKDTRRKETVPPFTVLMEGMVESLAATVESEADQSPEGKTCKEYCLEMQKQTGKQRVEWIIRDFRYGRWRGTWSKNRALFEVGLSPVCRPQGQEMLHAMTALLIKNAEAVPRHGIAPKGQLELRVEGILKKLNVYQDRNK